MIDAKVLSDAIRLYFRYLIDHGKREVSVVDCNADIQRIIAEIEKYGCFSLEAKKKPGWKKSIMRHFIAKE